LSAIVIGNPEVTVGVDRHTVRDARYVVRLEIVERFAVRCWEIEIVLSDIIFGRKKHSNMNANKIITNRSRNGIVVENSYLLGR